jgi:RND family efflux transporter MFP subunit
LLCAAACCLSAPGATLGSEFEGYTEPVRTIEVAADESGTVAEVLVRQGQRVRKGQPIMRLNCDVHRAQLELAKQQMAAEGRLDAARAEAEMTRQRLESIESLHATGHARAVELARARKEHRVAQANVRSIQEDLVARQLEHDRLHTQIDRRTIRAPVAGVVTDLHRDVGEFVAPNKPEVATLVQLDTLLANFALLSNEAHLVKSGQSVPVYFFDVEYDVTGVVTYVSPVIDAESGTVLVKVRIDNSAGTLRSGSRCVVKLPD